MKRPALATAVLLSAALATAACSNGAGQASSSSSSSSGASVASGSQSYASMLDLYTAVLGTGTKCSDVTIQPATTAKAQSTCDLGGSKSLLLQTWRNAGSRDNGVQAAENALSEQHDPYCVVAGTGDTGLWSVAARGDSGVCTTISHKLGGTVTNSASTH